jgi:uncharacterized protein (TIGR01244 family)
MASDHATKRPGFFGRILKILSQKGPRMSFRQIDSKYFVAGQIGPDDLPKLAEAGFETVICMRPDGEGFGQPSYADIEKAAKSVGIKTLYLPVRPGSMPLEHASKLKAALRETEGKVLGYCASGNRSTMLYQLASQAAA